MTTRASLIEMTAAARASMADPARSTIVNSRPPLRFELFHAASSLCSQKVRAVLHEKDLSYRSNDMLILSTMGSEGLVAAEHYSPAYIRLRLVAARELKCEYVDGYSGRTSVETEGFDPCVVPLLIDHEAGRVIADSQRICIYLDGISQEPHGLIPLAPDARAEVMRQVGIVDRIPNGALLYGFHPDADLRPEALKASMQTVYDYKVMALQRLIADNVDEPELVAAYRAKIAKESGGKKVCRDPVFQRTARGQTGQLLDNLERDLASGSFGFSNGHDFSLADVLWGVNLVRLNYLGLASMWDALPHVTRYFDLLAKRPSLCKEAIRASLDSLPYSGYMDSVADCTAEAEA